MDPVPTGQYYMSYLPLPLGLFFKWIDTLFPEHYSVVFASACLLRNVIFSFSLETVAYANAW